MADFNFEYWITKINIFLLSLNLQIIFYLTNHLIYKMSVLSEQQSKSKDMQCNIQ